MKKIEYITNRIHYNLKYEKIINYVMILYFCVLFNLIITYLNMLTKFYAKQISLFENF